MSLTELYSAMLQQVAERRRRQLERGSVAGDSPQPVLVEESHRIRALELENAQIKAGFSAFVNLLMKKGIIQHGDLEGLLKIPESQPQPMPPAHAEVIVTIPRSPNAPSGRKRKKRRR